MRFATKHRFSVRDYHRMGEDGGYFDLTRGLNSWMERLLRWAGYASITLVRHGETARLLAFPDAPVDVAQLLKR